MIKWANGDTYTGQWARGMRNGIGVLKEVSGDRYLGEWVDDERHGLVRFLSSTGDVRDTVWNKDIDTTTTVDASVVMEKLAHGMVWCEFAY